MKSELVLALAATVDELFPARSIPLPQMIRQRQRHAVAQFGLRDFVLGVEEDAAVAAVAEFRIELAEGFDQTGLAVEVDRILVGYQTSRDRSGWCCRFWSRP